ncbi:MAG: hypothetical protein ACOCWG_05850 [bacterium]
MSENENTVNNNLKKNEKKYVTGGRKIDNAGFFSQDMVSDFSDISNFMIENKAMRRLQDSLILSDGIVGHGYSRMYHRHSRT